MTGQGISAGPTADLFRSSQARENNQGRKWGKGRVRLFDLRGEKFKISAEEIVSTTVTN